MIYLINYTILKINEKKIYFEINNLKITFKKSDENVINCNISDIFFKLIE